MNFAQPVYLSSSRREMGPLGTGFEVRQSAAVGAVVCRICAPLSMDNCNE